MNRLYSLLGLLSALSLTRPALSQDWSFGPKAYLGLSRTLTVGDEATLPYGSLTTVGYGDATTSSIGAFVRYDRPRWYTEANLLYGSSYSANIQVNTATVGAPLYNKARRLDARLLVGYKPLPWLRLSAGLVGVSNNWKVGAPDNTAEISRLERQAQVETDPTQRERWLASAASYRITDAVDNALKTSLLEAQLGIGTDIGGLTLDVTYTPALTPVVDGVTYQGQTYALRQQYAFWSLGLGYKLFPLKKHLLAPRKNKAYARIQRDIPFIRNEFQVGFGLLAEDINSAFVYENRYTRYLKPRLGLTVGLSYQRGLSGFETAGLSAFQTGSFSVNNTLSLLAGLRVLPLYSRAHRIGLTLGGQFSYLGGNVGGGGSARSVTVNGQTTTIRTVRLVSRSQENTFRVVPQLSLDYQFLPTDRLSVGPWLRATTDDALYGLQAGYRF